MKKTLTERDICTQYITPAIQAGWDLRRQVREEVTFTAGKIIVQGKLHTRGKSKRADYILYHKPNLPIAVIEAKDNKHAVSDGMQQALAYVEVLDNRAHWKEGVHGDVVEHSEAGWSPPM